MTSFPAEFGRGSRINAAIKTQLATAPAAMTLVARRRDTLMPAAVRPLSRGYRHLVQNALSLLVSPDAPDFTRPFFRRATPTGRCAR